MTICDCSVATGDTMLAAADTKSSHWKYVSEGGATIVFSYIGPANPHFDGTVLRLRKISRAAGLADEADDPIVEFQKRCTSRLIPLIHLPRLRSVSLEKIWVQRMISLHDSFRPAERRSKDGIDPTRSKGVLATDLVGGDWVAVEIKPKWGFLPSSVHLSSETRPVKTKTCRYCMHSRVRAAQGEIQAIGYCPLDLFSGEEKRMRQAVSNLWDAWTLSDGAINNLKIFVRGGFIKPSEAPSMFAEGVVQSDVKEAFITALVSLVLGTPVLKRISYLQRTLDPFDIEGLSKFWRGVEDRHSVSTGSASHLEPDTNTGLFSEPTMDDWEGFVDKYLSSEMSQPDTSNLDSSRLQHYLLAYLLSATFKDCSIIVRLNFLGMGSNNNTIEPWRVSVIDLDRKSMARMEKWEELDRQIVQGYLKNGQEKRCIDEFRL